MPSAGQWPSSHAEPRERSWVVAALEQWQAQGDRDKLEAFMAAARHHLEDIQADGDENVLK
jgi:hypothetical protein